jgi:hypothetical protein
MGRPAGNSAENPEFPRIFGNNPVKVASATKRPYKPAAAVLRKGFRA